MPAAAADTTDEALDMRRECRRRRRLISDAVGDPTAIGTSVHLLMTIGLGLAVCDCTSTMAQRLTVVAVFGLTFIVSTGRRRQADETQVTNLWARWRERVSL